MNVNFAHYGEIRERIATESEIEIFKILKEITGNNDLELVRRSDNYVTAALGVWDLARFKYTPRAKWISFPTLEVGSAKHKIEDPEDVRQFGELITGSLENILKYL